MEEPPFESEELQIKELVEMILYNFKNHKKTTISNIFQHNKNFEDVEESFHGFQEVLDEIEDFETSLELQKILQELAMYYHQENYKVPEHYLS